MQLFIFIFSLCALKQVSDKIAEDIFGGTSELENSWFPLILNAIAICITKKETIKQQQVEELGQPSALLFCNTDPRLRGRNMKNSMCMCFKND